MEYTNYKESSFLYNVKCLAALRASCNVRGSGFPLPLS